MKISPQKILFLGCTMIVLVAGLSIGYSTLSVSTLDLGKTDLEVRVILKDLEIPWDMDWSNDGWIWFSEKKGRISRFSPDSGVLQEMLFLEDVFQSADNSGLHALALHPEFPGVPHVYAHYTYSQNQSRLVRYSFDAANEGLGHRTVLLDELPAHVSHNGSRIVFSPDGSKLFLALGDAHSKQMAQDVDSPSGKILRMNLDGSIPADNPFPNSLTWSYGHRNPQGLVMAANNKLYSSEHGARTDDELNIIEKGENYGFPLVQGFCDSKKEANLCDEHDVVVPLMVWSPTFGVSAVEFYDHEAIPEWRNSILITSLKASRNHTGIDCRC